MRVGKKRVLRLMREHGLLAPTRSGHRHGNPAHTGKITTDRPDELWGTDATVFYAGRDGWCWFFGAIDHGTDEIVGWKTTKRGDRWAALEPIHQGVRYAFGAFGKDIARGLTVRHDWAPQYTSHAFCGELGYLGIQQSPSFVGEPECNGVIERFMRTLKEQCLWVHDFESLEHATRVIGEFIELYNSQWLIERLGHKTPRQARQEMTAQAA
jgi:transposase InsO family protein